MTESFRSTEKAGGRQSHQKRAVSFVVFADDWGRHPSSCQHLFRYIIPRYDVIWVNTIGMRRPQFNIYCFRRGLEKIVSWVSSPERQGRPKREIAPKPLVVNPLMWPWHEKGWQRRLNRVLVKRYVNRWLRHLPGRRVGVTTLPIVADFMSDLKIDCWVYYCVDDFRHWPEVNRRVIESLEEKLIYSTQEIIAAGDRLAKRIAMLGRTAHVLTHGIDVEMWAGNHKAYDALEKQVPGLGNLEKPWIVFWGSVNWQVDAEVIEEISRKIEKGTILLVGPVSDCDQRLLRINRVAFPGAIDYELLPILAREAAVLIMPYKVVPGVYESEPLKLKEYLATQRPVIVCDIPATRRWADALDIARSAEEFATLVRERLFSGIPAEQARAREKVKDESWQRKAEQFLEIVLQEENG